MGAMMSIVGEGERREASQALVAAAVGPRPI
jgi:hypothetical protein